MAGLNENSGWIALQANKVYRICSLGSSNSKFLEFEIAVPNWQGASFFRFYIAASYMADGTDIKTGVEGAVGKDINIYRNGLVFYVVLSDQASASLIKLLRKLSIGGATIDTSIVESALPDGAVKIL